MEPPSNELKLGLQRLKLATDRDLQHCRAHVRKLARGLPAFDSVWIDALVSKQKLTPFQAEFFHQKRWQELQVGEDILLTRQLHFDAMMPLFAGVIPETQTPVIITRFQLNHFEMESQRQRIQNVIQKLAKGTIAACPINFHIHPDGHTLDVVSSAILGEGLNKLLVRRGRFPEQVVRAIAVGICENELSLGSDSLHGDLRLSNVWLTPKGEIALLNTGVLNALVPRLTIHTQLPLDAYDGISPERFETLQEISIPTEMYALGCLLWQLLAGRPPFPLADPLAKIAAHRQKHIPDIRDIAPDTSAELANLIQSLTHRRPTLRPTTFNAVQHCVAEGIRHPQQRLQQFLQAFESAAPRQLGQVVQQRSIVGMKAITTGLLTIAITVAATVAFWQRDSLGLPALPLASARVAEASASDFHPLETFVVPRVTGLESENHSASEISAPSASAKEETRTLMELPEADESGTIWLENPGPFQVSSIRVNQQLTLRGTSGIPPVLVITDNLSTLSAEHIVLENISLEFREDASLQQRSLPLLKIITQQLTLSGCVIRNEQSGSEALLSWRAKSPNEVGAGRLLVTNTACATARPCIASNTPVSTVLFENVLQTGIGSLLELQGGVSTGLLVPVVFNQCTLSQPVPLIRIDHPESIFSGGKLSLRGRQSIFACAAESPLLAFTGSQFSNPHLDERWANFLEISAEGLIVPQDAMLIGQRANSTQSWSPVSTDRLNIDGLISGTFTFVPGVSLPAEEISPPILVIEELSVRSSAQPPGFNVEQFKSAQATIQRANRTRFALEREVLRSER